ncbi:hypothetical protein [Jiella mangrovi]|uniref:Uncharacterized protein n=1 Tax=Jiella mangrovi TaxID=2821407 RepID=A0ABS4BG89_9HYPH|nr:hypothetical protein [Jiella mangrovi]MBP0615762.1 hypothetical protein [Jiella mangrovi]
MAERHVGIVASGEKITIVDLEVPDDGPATLNLDDNWKLQEDDREGAYATLFAQLTNYLREHGIQKVVVKASDSSKGMGLSHLKSAEVRGVVIAAASTVCPTKAVAKSVLSRTFGERKVDAYLDDKDFWEGKIAGREMKKGSREAVFMVLADQNK